jgi:hypothetical protein
MISRMFGGSYDQPTDRHSGSVTGSNRKLVFALSGRSYPVFLAGRDPEISTNNKAAQQVVGLIGGMFWFIVLVNLAFARHS